MIANQLSVKRKEVVWMLQAREKKRNRQKIAEHERENAAMLANNKNWELLTREVSTLTAQNLEIINQNEKVIAELKKMEVKIEEVQEKKL